MRKITAFLLCGALFHSLVLTSCRNKDTQQVSSSDNVKISYEVRGQGEPALVFVHGWSCDKTVWEYQVPYFSQNHKVVTIDLGGHGQSGLGRKQWTVQAYGNDVASVIKKLDLKNVVLIGHSMGGAVIAETTRQVPDRVICLVGADTFHDIQGYTKEMLNEMIAGLKPDYNLQAKALVRRMFPEDADPNIIEQIAEKIASANPVVAINSLGNLGDYDLKEAFKDISVPVYSINSDFWPTSPEANKNYIKSFEVKIMPGIGHFVMLEDADKFNKLLDEILDELHKRD